MMDDRGRTTRAGRTALALAWMVLTGCAPALADEPDDNAATVAALGGGDGGAEAARFVTARARRGADGSLRGYLLAPANQGRMRCGDGRVRAQCLASRLDLGTLELDEAERRSFERRLGDPRAHAAVVLRGRFRPAGAVDFVVDAAWIAPATPSTGGPLYHLRSAPEDCAFQPCLPKQAQVANGRDVRPIGAIELHHAPGREEERDLAWVDATSAAGLLAHGAFVQAGDGAGPLVFDVQGYYLRVLPGAGCRCGDALGARIRAASERLLYPSESDRPIEFFARRAAGAGALTPAQVVSLTRQLAPLRIETRPIASFFVGRTDPPSDGDPGLDALAARYRVLHRLLDASLQWPRVFRIGAVEIDVYVLGRDRCGNAVGIQTAVVET